VRQVGRIGVRATEHDTDPFAFARDVLPRQQGGQCCGGAVFHQYSAVLPQCGARRDDLRVGDQDRGRERVGSQLLDRLLEEAVRMEARTVRLDTVRFMADAQRLYRSRGFAERTPYEGTEIPPHLQQYWIFFERG
jgi:hypothetical protein